MNRKEVREQITGLIEPFLEKQNLELVHLEYRPGKRGHLCIYIDKPGGVTLEDCERVSRDVSDLLDAYDPIPHSFILEVSSPGVERPLHKSKDYERFQGEMVKVYTEEPIDGRRKFNGTLAGLEGGNVAMLLEGGARISIPLEKISKAHLRYTP